MMAFYIRARNLSSYCAPSFASALDYLGLVVVVMLALVPVLVPTFVAVLAAAD